MDLIIHMSFTFLNKTKFKKESEARVLEGLFYYYTTQQARTSSPM